MENSSCWALIHTSNFRTQPSFDFCFPNMFCSCGLNRILVERLVVRHLYDRIFDSLLATWGISILIREIVEMIWGRSFRNVPPPIDGVLLLGLDYPAFRLLVMLATVVFALVLYRWYKRA